MDRHPEAHLVLDVAGIQVAVSHEAIAELFLDHVRAEALRPIITERSVANLGPPAIGSAWKGGIYAGVARGRDGTPDAHLIVLEESERKLNWKDALAWAGQSDDQRLPTRAEQALCFANVPELFEKTWYWSNEQAAGGEACAWSQYFDTGTQYGTRKDGELRARAVRRLPIK